MIETVSSCNVCGSSSIDQVIDLPSLPLTGLYYPNLTLALKSSTFDQGLCLCTKCGHCQLSNVIDPSVVYDETYTHRSSESPLSRNGNDFLFKYITKSIALSASDCVLEAGCNDGYLLDKLYSFNSLPQYYGFDPIWLSNKPPEKNFSIFGSFIEDVNPKLQGINPTLIISAHTFEHVVSLRDSLLLLVEKAAKDARIIIEMPSFDSLIRLKRFDQIFHQHIQYISENSIFELCNQLSCTLNNIAYNYSYWGGTVILDFSKKPSIKSVSPFSAKQKRLSIESSYNDFLLSINSVANSLHNCLDVSYLGAAQMLPILHYHVKDSISFNRVLDDNPKRIGTFLPNLDLPIEPLSSHLSSSSSPASFIIGAVDSTRALVSRTRELNIPNVFTFFNSLI